MKMLLLTILRSRSKMKSKIRIKSRMNHKIKSRMNHKSRNFANKPENTFYIANVFNCSVRF